MGMFGRICGLMLCLLLGAVAAPVRAASQDLDVTVQRLPGAALPQEVLSGARDALLLPAEAQPDVLRPGAPGTSWWRITSRRDMAAEAEPQLVLTAPYLSRVEVWRPGSTIPDSRSLYGSDYDSRYSTRALVFPLAGRVHVGDSVWLRVTTAGAVPMRLSIETRDDVHRSDLAYIGGRMAILGSTAILLVLAMVMWLRVRDPHYALFTVAMISIVLYLTAMGGELRFIPGLAEIFGASSAPQRIVGGVGVIASNMFLWIYMDLPRQMPKTYRLLQALTVAIGISTFGSALVAGKGLTLVANITILLVALTIVASSITLTLRGSRQGVVVMVSWIPLAIFSALRVLQIVGWWSGPEWADHLQSFGFAIGGLLLMLGTTEQMLHLRQEHERVSHIARVDTVTGTLSRGALDRALAESLAHAQHTGTIFSLVFIDVDHFKQVNDVHGHAVGDACLRFIAMRARNHMRSTDVLGRYGGDELLAILPGADGTRAREVAANVHHAVAVRPLMIDELHLPCTLSLGAAQWRPGERIEDTLQRADAALYRSKAAGRNCVHLAPGDNPNAEELLV
ncbi:MAG: diguanylate cyclase [Pseudoxanthomonas sp.]